MSFNLMDRKVEDEFKDITVGSKTQIKTVMSR